MKKNFVDSLFERRPNKENKDYTIHLALLQLAKVLFIILLILLSPFWIIASAAGLKRK